MTTSSEPRASAWAASGFIAQRTSSEKELGVQDSLTVLAADPTPLTGLEAASEERGVEPRCILAVADGHGDRKYVRSSRGARFACRASVAASTDLLDFAADAYEESLKRGQLRRQPNIEIDNYVSADLPRAVVKYWHDDVWDSAQVEPNDLDASLLGLTPEEWNETFAIDDGDKRLQGQIPPLNWRRLYGSTLLGFAATARLAAVWQIGDGATVIVGRDFDADDPIPVEYESKRGATGIAGLGPGGRAVPDQGLVRERQPHSNGAPVHRRAGGRLPVAT